MRYQEYAPSAILANAVRCIWTLEGNADDLMSAVQPILPDGRAEIVVHLGDSFEVMGERGVTQRQSRILFAGQLTGPLALRPTGAIAVVGVRFHADGATAFVNAPQHRIVGQTVELKDVSMRLARDLPMKGGETLDGDRVTEPLLQRPFALERRGRVPEMTRQRLGAAAEREDRRRGQPADRQSHAI